MIINKFIEQKIIFYSDYLVILYKYSIVLI